MMITLENTLWMDAVQAIPQLAWRNLHQFRDVPGGMRGVLADEARVRNLRWWVGCGWVVGGGWWWGCACPYLLTDLNIVYRSGEN